MIRIDETNRTIYDDYIVKVGSITEATNTIKKFKELGYNFFIRVEKDNCYYIAQRVVMDEGFLTADGKSVSLFVRWGRKEVEESNEFSKMLTYEQFMKL